jgi:glycerol-3-phosphate acyltransferase PlsX
MGGDHGVGVVVPAALDAVDRYPDLKLILVGDRAVIEKALSENHAGESERLEIRHASQSVDMGEPPALALRNKKDSSMRVAINMLKAGEADACVSAGNTGALMATAKYVLKTLPGIDRPAICTALPSVYGHTHMLDLGANVDCTADQLYQFAMMGSVLASAVDNKKAPRVGLLNVGQEAIKGNDTVKEAGDMLADSPLNYIGFVEGDDIYLSDVDVVVCDGFVGNVSVKTSEGVAKMVGHVLKQVIKENLLYKALAVVTLPLLRNLRKQIDPRQYNGASLLGLQGIVVKSHGGSDRVSFGYAIRIARIEAQKNIPQLIDKQLEVLLSQKKAS